MSGEMPDFPVEPTQAAIEAGRKLFRETFQEDLIAAERTGPQEDRDLSQVSLDTNQR